MDHPIKEIVRLQKKGIPVGIFSVCSANKYVIEGSLKRGLDSNAYVLIEATANQVHQYGGYTGMKPADFIVYVRNIAKRVKFPFEKIIFGGDHLGPLTWKHMNENEAMKKAEVLVFDYVKAGFSKIHIDTSMKLRSDKEGVLDVRVIAERGARLVLAAENAFKQFKSKNQDALEPVYVIGSEVPIPGGSNENAAILEVTTVEGFKKTVMEFKAAFKKYKLKCAWENVVAVVVQPGVEFGDTSIIEYDRHKAKDLTIALKEYTNIVFEGHSTDYQTPKKLRSMVEDGVAILKVGPGLTFAYREVLFSLESIEMELLGQESIKRSNLKSVLDKEMLKNSISWINHYHGTDDKLRLARRYSFLDRARYYMSQDSVEDAVECLLRNLGERSIPLSLLSQFLPLQYKRIRDGIIENDPHEIIIDSIGNVLEAYYYAVTPY